MNSDLAALSATELRRLIGCREVSPVEVVHACLSRIERYNPVINAFCTLSDRALEEAREAEARIVRGEPLGLLHGLPVAIKDVTDSLSFSPSPSAAMFPGARRPNCGRRPCPPG